MASQDWKDERGFFEKNLSKIRPQDEMFVNKQDNRPVDSPGIDEFSIGGLVGDRYRRRLSARQRGGIIIDASALAMNLWALEASAKRARERREISTAVGLVNRFTLGDPEETAEVHIPLTGMDTALPYGFGKVFSPADTEVRGNPAGFVALGHAIDYMAQRPQGPYPEPFTPSAPKAVDPFVMVSHSHQPVVKHFPGI